MSMPSAPAPVTSGATGGVPIQNTSRKDQLWTEPLRIPSVSLFHLTMYSPHVTDDLGRPPRTKLFDRTFFATSAHFHSTAFAQTWQIKVPASLSLHRGPIATKHRGSIATKQCDRSQRHRSTQILLQVKLPAHPSRSRQASRLG